MTQWLRGLTILGEDLGSVANSQVVAHKLF